MHTTVLVSTDKKSDEKIAECPGCHHEASTDDGGNLVDEDYGSNGMIWCEICGGLFFLDYEQERDAQIEKYFVREVLRNVKYGRTAAEVRQESFNEYKIPVLKIARTTGRAIYQMTRDLTDQEIRDFYSEMKMENYFYRPSVESLEKYGIISRDDQFDPDEICHNDGFNEEKCMKGECTLVSLPVNSYNLEKPEIPYPKELDMSHDGSMVYVTFENGKNGYVSGD